MYLSDLLLTKDNLINSASFWFLDLFCVIDFLPTEVEVLKILVFVLMPINTAILWIKYKSSDGFLISFTTGCRKTLSLLMSLLKDE